MGLRKNRQIREMLNRENQQKQSYYQIWGRGHWCLLWTVRYNTLSPSSHHFLEFSHILLLARLMFFPLTWNAPDPWFFRAPTCPLISHTESSLALPEPFAPARCLAPAMCPLLNIYFRPVTVQGTLYTAVHFPLMTPLRSREFYPTSQMIKLRLLQSESEPRPKPLKPMVLITSIPLSYIVIICLCLSFQWTLSPDGLESELGPSLDS